jgi:hypothetical protein
VLEKLSDQHPLTFRFNHRDIMTEEYQQKKGRDWMGFIISTVVMLGILWFKPEWVWVAWPFQFTFLTGALGRM